mmetsp:Transcript_34487/g.83447  ORF Transcript_34487/g.83447 Transcript_34487/m.83447 type:complete len:190 (-) Transcript_34487:72-641(-)|eukprot:CAMPEP_0181093870 /NCGR_PEP_ID=MMETSP1071-20121207/9684_1 /TAXON_ID=35127 /ORGANISM="Thalassiosira sp., Strain NH16" /LENGTH=189 /DNA_ID=CAMNT_0023176149 /DNA_START=180 /DNA_END=749 /DNA_ORIENTATION=-
MIEKDASELPFLFSIFVDQFSLSQQQLLTTELKITALHALHNLHQLRTRTIDAFRRRGVRQCVFDAFNEPLHLIGIVLGMIRILEAFQETLDIGDVFDKVLLLICQLIDEGLVLFEIATLMKAEFGHVLDAHFVDRTELGGGIQRLHHVPRHRLALRAHLECDSCGKACDKEGERSHCSLVFLLDSLDR